MIKKEHSKNFTRNMCCSLILFAAVAGFLFYLDQNSAQNSYTISILQRSAIYAIVAVSMNLLTGFTGLFSLGQAGFMAIGAYTVAILTIPVETRPKVYYINGIADSIANIEVHWLAALLLGGTFAALVACLVGIPVLRLKSDYLAIATLGFAEIIRAIIASPQMDKITNGSYGLKSIPGFSSIYVPFIMAFICIGFMVLLIRSSYGRAFKAIRENEIAAEAMGVDLFKHKEMAFVISSFFTGIGGGLLAMYMRSIEAKTFQVSLTYDLLLIVVLGGIGSVTGSILGSFLMNGGREWLRFFDEPLIIAGVSIPLFRSGFRMVIFSLLLMAVVLFWRRGLMGSREFTWNGLFGLPKKIADRFSDRGKQPPQGGQMTEGNQ